MQRHFAASEPILAKILLESKKKSPQAVSRRFFSSKTVLRAF